jgi:hypothetical protein
MTGGLGSRALGLGDRLRLHRSARVRVCVHGREHPPDMCVRAPVRVVMCACVRVRLLVRAWARAREICPCARARVRARVCALLRARTVVAAGLIGSSGSISEMIGDRADTNRCTCR